MTLTIFWKGFKSPTQIVFCVFLRGYQAFVFEVLLIIVFLNGFSTGFADFWWIYLVCVGFSRSCICCRVLEVFIEISSAF